LLNLKTMYSSISETQLSGFHAQPRFFEKANFFVG
jgi:hypothetical protein